MTGFSRPSIRLLHPTELEQALLIDESDLPANTLQEPSLIEPAEQPGDSSSGPDMTMSALLLAGSMNASRFARSF